MPRALAQPPQPRDQEDGVDRAGGQAPLRAARPHGQPLGRDRQAPARPQRQRHQEPLELDDEEALRGECLGQSRSPQSQPQINVEPQRTFGRDQSWVINYLQSNHLMYLVINHDLVAITNCCPYPISLKIELR